MFCKWVQLLEKRVSYSLGADVYKILHKFKKRFTLTRWIFVFYPRGKTYWNIKYSVEVQGKSTQIEVMRMTLMLFVTYVIQSWFLPFWYVQRNKSLSLICCLQMQNVSHDTQSLTYSERQNQKNNKKQQQQKIVQYHQITSINHSVIQSFNLISMCISDTVLTNFS